MTETAKNEMIYLAAYGLIKCMTEQGIISKDAFERLNSIIAKEKVCKPVEA